MAASCRSMSPSEIVTGSPGPSNSSIAFAAATALRRAKASEARSERARADAEARALAAEGQRDDALALLAAAAAVATESRIGISAETRLSESRALDCAAATGQSMLQRRLGALAMLYAWDGLRRRSRLQAFADWRTVAAMLLGEARLCECGIGTKLSILSDDEDFDQLHAAHPDFSMATSQLFLGTSEGSKPGNVEAASDTAYSGDGADDGNTVDAVNALDGCDNREGETLSFAADAAPHVALTPQRRAIGTLATSTADVLVVDNGLDWETTLFNPADEWCSEMQMEKLRLSMSPVRR
uniref:Uncharacterized protein n=1 Tax=Chrysotila carterae TaxID=13221 RepID=A0A7S4BZY9_CHRCT